MRLFTIADQLYINEIARQRDSLYQRNADLAARNVELATLNLELSREILRRSVREAPPIEEGDIPDPPTRTEADQRYIDAPEAVSTNGTRPQPRMPRPSE